jgi:hypothetical protein
MNRPVAQASGVRVRRASRSTKVQSTLRSNATKDEAPRHRPNLWPRTTAPGHAGTVSSRGKKIEARLSMNLKVGRAVLCAPTFATTLSRSAKGGAHGVTRPTSANQFMAPMRVQFWRLRLSMNRLQAESVLGCGGKRSATPHSNCLRSSLHTKAPSSLRSAGALQRLVQ